MDILINMYKHKYIIMSTMMTQEQLEGTPKRKAKSLQDQMIQMAIMNAEQ